MTTPTDISIPEEARREMALAPTLLTNARAFVISKPEQSIFAGAEMREIVTRRKSLEEARMAITRPMDEAKKRVMDLFRPPLDALEEAERSLKRAIARYEDEQEQIRIAAQRKADEVRRRQEEKLAEQARAARAKADAEAHALREQAAALDAKNREELEARALALEAAAEAQAERLEERAAAIPTVLVASNAPNVAGVSTRKLYSAEVTDLVALARAVANGQIPPTAIMPNQPYLNSRAVSDKEFLAIPGVKLVVTTSVAGRRI